MADMAIIKKKLPIIHKMHCLKYIERSGFLIVCWDMTPARCFLHGCEQTQSSETQWSWCF